MPMLSLTEAVAALGAFLRLRRDGGMVRPELAARLDAVLGALGVYDAVNELSEQEAAVLLGFVEGFLAQSTDFVVNPGRTSWDYEDTSILIAQGQTSASLAPVFRRFVVPSLGAGLAARMEAGGASFLDVGTGIAALAVAMCRLWPALRVVGVDPWEPALTLARERVARAGLAERIDLRQMAAETLEDADEHDLAWVPTFFIASTVLERVIERVHAALRPGGYAIFGLYTRPDDPLAAVVADLRTVRQGGAPHTPQEMTALLARSGFADIDVLFDVAWRVPVVFVVGRRRAHADGRQGGCSS